MGAGANVNAFRYHHHDYRHPDRGEISFNWLFTMYQGRIVLHSAMMWTIGFIVTFGRRGTPGVLLAVPGVTSGPAQQFVPDCALP